MSSPVDEQPHERRGHHPEHVGLQRHSIGEAYPLAVVGYANGHRMAWRVENLMTGQCVCLASAHPQYASLPRSGPLQWFDTMEPAYKLLDSIHRKQVLTGDIGIHVVGQAILPLAWGFAPRPWPECDRIGTHGTQTELPSVAAAQAATYKPVHGGYPGDETPPRAFNKPGSGPMESR